APRRDRISAAKPAEIVRSARFCAGGGDLGRFSLRCKIVGRSLTCWGGAVGQPFMKAGGKSAPPAFASAKLIGRICAKKTWGPVAIHAQAAYNHQPASFCSVADPPTRAEN